MRYRSIREGLITDEERNELLVAVSDKQISEESKEMEIQNENQIKQQTSLEDKSSEEDVIPTMVNLINHIIEFILTFSLVTKV